MSYDDLGRNGIAIKVEGLSKVYDVYSAPLDRLKSALYGRLRGIFKLKPRVYSQQYHALTNVQFEVSKGETVGIVGHNGAGKSTILQIICGTLEPSSGTVTVNGRIAALLELGAGFNPEFTGKENVYLGAVIAGVGRQEIEDKYDEIVEFAEIGSFIDQPVKTYSSGMYIRLAFAVSIVLTPDILIVDEALAVGDAYFQKKCQDRLARFTDSGGTLLLVTHSTESLISMCDRGIVLDKGYLVFDGNTKDAVASYMKRLFGSHSKGNIKTNVAAEIGSPIYDLTEFKSNPQEAYELNASYNRNEIRLGDGRAIVADVFVEGYKRDEPIVVYSGASLVLFVRYSFHSDLSNVIMGAMLNTVTGAKLYASNTFNETGNLYSFNKGDNVLSKITLQFPIMPGKYFLTLGVSKFDERCVEIEALDRRMDSLVVTVLSRKAGGEGVVNMAASFDVDIHI